MSRPASGPSRLDQAGFVFLLIWCLGTFYLFFKGPAANENQQLFRIAIFAVGACGTIVIAIMKFSRRQ